MSENIILTDLKDLSDIIHNPLKQTQRIKYTASDISQNLIILGATSGSLYLFEREPCKFIQIIPGNNGAIAQISISNDENYVAISTFKGAICIVTLDIIDACSIHVVVQNENSLATCFYWDQDCDKKLYFGDSTGNVVLIQLSYLLGRTVLHSSTHSILLLDSTIIQISGVGKLILVSTTTKCVLCNTEKEEFKQIGNKPRDGDYGACFIIPSDANNEIGINKLKVFCARPGMRLWEVDIEGNVLQTHQIKNYLINKLPNQILNNIRNDIIINDKTDLISTKLSSSPTSSTSTPPTSSSSESNNLTMIDLLSIEKLDDNNKLVNKISMQFSKLYSFYGKYLFTYTDNLILMFDTEHRLINLLNTQFTNIKHINFIINKKHNSLPNQPYDEKYLYIINKHMKFYVIKLYFLNEYLFLLNLQQNYIECYNLIKNYYDYFLNIIQVKNSNSIDVIKILKQLNKIFLNLNLINNDDNNNLNILFKKLNDNNRITINDNNISNNHDDDVDDDVVNDENDDSINTHKNGIVVVNNKINNIATQFKLNNKLLATLNNSEDINNISGSSNTINNDEEKILWNLYMVYKTSKISNINFIERYTNIFDKYELKYVINLIEKLKILLHEHKIKNNLKPNDDININCIKLFFDYLKIEMIWEIGDGEREYIMKSFIMINNQNNCDNNFVCADCKFPLNILNSCEYKDIGLMLLQYYWSRKDYNTCFNLCSRVTYLMRIINKFYIDERDYSNLIPYCVIIGDIEILLKAIEIFDIQHWYEFYDFFNLYQLNYKHSRYYCLKCKQFINFNKNICNNDHIVNEEQNLVTATQLNWNIILNLSIDCIKGVNALKLIDKYNETVTNDLIGRDFYLKCLLKP